MNEEKHNKIEGYLRRKITRRQAIKAGGLAALGLAFSKPIIDTIRPTPLFAQYGGNGGGGDFSGCTPGRWKNKLGDWPTPDLVPDGANPTKVKDAFKFDVAITVP